MFEDFIDGCSITALTEEVLESLRSIVLSTYWDNYVCNCFGYNDDLYEDDEDDNLFYGDRYGDLIDCFDEFTLVTKLNNRVVLSDLVHSYKFLVDSEDDLNSKEFELSYFVSQSKSSSDYLPKCLGCIQKDGVMLVCAFYDFATVDKVSSTEGLLDKIQDSMKNVGVFLPHLNNDSIVSYIGYNTVLLDSSDWIPYDGNDSFAHRLMNGFNN